MIVQDVLYGSVELPEYIEELAAMPPLQRLRGISQAVLPASVMSWPVPNRYDHSLGVSYLATLVAAVNNLLPRDAHLLIVAALLHDAGSPPFSHLSEPFMTDWTGFNGEEYLAKILHDQPGMVRALLRIGVYPYEVVRCVAGRGGPFTRVLHGSLDIDNADNIPRYWKVVKRKGNGVMGEVVASSFQCKEGVWALGERAYAPSRLWRALRRTVYAFVHEDEHLSVVAMVGRALDLTFEREQIKEAFFRLDDDQAFAFLSEANASSVYLTDAVASGRHHVRAGAIESSSPSEKLLALAANWRTRYDVANEVASHLGVPRHLVCAYCSYDMDDRRIDLPFVRASGETFIDEQPKKVVFRLKVYVDQELSNQTAAVSSALSAFLDM